MGTMFVGEYRGTGIHRVTMCAEVVQSYRSSTDA